VLSAVLKKKMEKKAKGKDKKIHPDLTKTKKGEQDVKSPETIKQKIIVEGIDQRFELEENIVEPKDPVKIKRTEKMTL
jgi:hypothetical protein